MTIIIILLSVLLLSCPRYGTTTIESLESTNNKTVQGHASPAKQARSPASCRCTDKFRMNSHHERPTIDDVPGTPAKRR